MQSISVSSLTAPTGALPSENEDISSLDEQSEDDEVLRKSSILMYMKTPTITICSSAAFYETANKVKESLESMGFTVYIPDMAIAMKEQNDYDVSHYKTWYEDDGDYHKKQALMRGHFDKVVDGDVTLVLNYEKNGQQNYIGGNVLMEMALAFFYNKPIYILNDFPENSPLLEEIKGVGSIPLHGNLESLKDLLVTK